LRGGVHNLVIPLTAFRRKRYAAQETPKIDAARACPGPDPGAEKDPFRMETNYFFPVINTLLQEFVLYKIY